MTQLLRSLQPRYEPAGHIILEEMQECLEIVFAMKGTIGIGFEINKARHYAVKMQNGCVIGGFNVTFFRCSNYIWKCMDAMEGFFLYK